MNDFIPLGDLIFFLDMLAAVAFAVSGTMVASRKELDILGFMWLAFITGVGGGTLRDLVLGVPVFWVAHPEPVIACLLTAAVMFWMAPRLESRLQFLLWFDAVGLSFVTVVGTAKGLEAGTGPLIAVVMGVMTASVGGIIRDVIGGEVSIILRREIYVTAAVCGAMCYVCMMALNLDATLSAAVAFLLILVIRGLAMTLHWSLPSHKRVSRTDD